MSWAPCWRPLGDTDSWAANLLASALLVAGWGFFLYQGVADPNGGINALWPIFGIANQLLAVIAFSLGTTILIKLGKVRYLWVTLVPLGFPITVTFTAGWMKIFSPNPRLGFLAGAKALEGKLAAGLLPPHAAGAQIFNARLDALVTGAFLMAVLAIVLGSVRVWVLLLRGERSLASGEAPFVAIPDGSP